MSNMKAQINYETLVSLTLFVSAIIYLIYEMVTFYPSYAKDLNKEVLYAEAYQISQILINDAGEPRDWFNSISTARRIGLLNESYNTLNLLSLRKVITFNSTCNSNYPLVKSLIGARYNFGVILRLSNGTIILNCGSAIGENAMKISRVVSLDDHRSYGELIIWVY